MSEHPVAPDSGTVASAVELAKQTAILGELLRQDRADLLDIAIGDFQGREMVLEQFPTAGSRRIIVFRTGAGNPSLAVPTTGVLALPDNAGRLGGAIVNSGTNAVVLYLCGAGIPTQGVPAIYLSANGGAWDFRLGNVLWAGNVTAVALVGASTLTIAEV